MTRYAARVAVGVLAALAAACSFPTKVLVNNDFSCLGSGDPTSAPAIVTIEGTTADEVTQTPLPGVALTLYLEDVSTPKTMGSSAPPDGDFELMDVTTGTPRSGYIQASLSGYLDTYVFPGAPLDTTPIPLLIAMFNQTTDLAAIGSATMKTLSTANAQGVVLVTDCMQMPVAGATVTIEPPPEAIVYANNDMPAPTATSTDSTGLAFVINQPPGSPTINATVDGVALRNNQVMAIADSVIVAIVQP